MPPPSRLLVMAVTRLGDGVCAACVDEQCKWIRPTRENEKGWRQLAIDDLKDPGGQIVVKVGNVVRWVLDRPAPRDVHTEDVFVSPARPQLEKTLSQPALLDVCERLCEDSTERYLAGGGRSLAMFRPTCVMSVEFGHKEEDKLTARVCFRHDRYADDLSVTDLAWRALGRSLLRQSGKKHLSLRAEQLRHSAGLSIRYLAVGRGQPFSETRHPLAGEYHPFIISVMTDRDGRPPIDYTNL